MNYKKEIEQYVPFNEQEVCDKEQFLKFIDTFDDVLTREKYFWTFYEATEKINVKTIKGKLNIRFIVFLSEII